MLRCVLPAGGWIGGALLVLCLLAAVVLGACAGGDQQSDGDEGAPATWASAVAGDEEDRSETRGSVSSTRVAETAVPTEVMANGGGDHCHAPGHWGTSREEPFEKHFLAWTDDGRRLVFDDRATVYAVDIVDGSRNEVALANRGPVNLLYGVFGSMADGRLVFTTCLYSDTPQPFTEVFPDLPEADSLNDTYELAMVDLELEEDIQGEVARVTRTPEWLELYPVWAPDGERLAYLAVPHGGYGHFRTTIRIVTADGEVEGSASIVRDVAWAPPQWSPDGRYLAVLANEAETLREGSRYLPRQNLYTIELEGGQLHKVSDATGLPSCAPDGETIAFGRGGEPGSPLALYVAGPDGTDLRRVAPEEGGFGVPEFLTARASRERAGLQRNDLRVSQVAWSPDGEHILVIVEYQRTYLGHGNTAAIYVVKADGSDMWRLDLNDHLPAAFRAAWSPDGKRIAVRVDMDYPKLLTSEYQSLLVLLTVAWDGTDTQVLIDRIPREGRYVGEFAEEE